VGADEPPSASCFAAAGDGAGRRRPAFRASIGLVNPSFECAMTEISSESPSQTPPTDGLPFLVVGVGASAGGLEAYTELIDELPGEPGLALLLVSHLDPDQKSHLAPILSRVSRMPVHEVTEGMAVVPDNVYVIPPGTNMAMTDGHLTLRARSPRGEGEKGAGGEGGGGASICGVDAAPHPTLRATFSP